ncbi:unnamed protein product [Protopolystoma xenopodis]|uniref:Uncharacterized protein n=1 Tax=Protopolystoma xenopodis TaxID=117903 RepID=A0A3S5FH18_9PLAT|nr:unnamed protein product [Protopolystoma xenopodis]
MLLGTPKGHPNHFVQHLVRELHIHWHPWLFSQAVTCRHDVLEPASNPVDGANQTQAGPKLQWNQNYKTFWDARLEEIQQHC